MRTREPQNSGTGVWISQEAVIFWCGYCSHLKWPSRANTGRRQGVCIIGWIGRLQDYTVTSATPTSSKNWALGCYWQTDVTDKVTNGLRSRHWQQCLKSNTAYRLGLRATSEEASCRRQDRGPWKNLWQSLYICLNRVQYCTSLFKYCLVNTDEWWLWKWDTSLKMKMRGPYKIIYFKT